MRKYTRPTFVIVLLAAAVVRLYKLDQFPVGPFVDEIFTLNSSLLQLERSFDPFGHTLVISEAWGKDHPNLFLYLNLVILKLFGLHYWSAKLLPVLAGVAASGLVFLITRRVLDDRTAFANALLFTFAHWSVRLSRYGWDVSLMIALFAAAIWLLLLTLKSGGMVYGFASGVAAGLGLYTYLGARIAVLSLLIFVTWECAVRRDRPVYRQAIAFAIGLAAAAFPFFGYYWSDPKAFWARSSEVSVFNNPHPVAVVLRNIASHALMFHWHGGTFARDNFPGLPMVDPMTGFLLIIGLMSLVRRRDTFGRLLLCTFLLNFAGGVFSISQEGAPYIYRTAAVIVPAFLIIGIGLQWLAENIRSRWLVAWCAATIAVNLYLYFGLEAKNTAAMRVMAYEPRLIGLEIASDNEPVWLISPDVLTQTEVAPKPGERYAGANPAVVLPPALRKLAIINYSGRYDLHRPVSENLEHPDSLYFVEPSALETNSLRVPAKIIFKSDDRQMSQTAARLGASIRFIPNMLGEPLFTVADLGPVRH